MNSATSALTFLVRSDTRRETLVVLDQDGPLDRHEIEDRIDASRRTVFRILNTLVEEDCVQSRGEIYRLTALGEFVVGLYQEWQDQLTLAKRYRPFLGNVGNDLFDVDLRSLRGSDLTVSTEVNPYAAMDRYLSLKDGATQVRAVTPMVDEQCFTQTARQLGNRETFEIEVIISQEVVGSRTGDDSVLETIRAEESASRLVYPGSIETMVAVVDDVAVFGAYTEPELHALLESDAPELLECATGWIDEFRRDAVPVEEFRE